jgi:Chloramphenicol phosphotransferase-like protein
MREPVLFPRLLSGLHHSIAALASAGNNLIVDHMTVSQGRNLFAFLTDAVRAAWAGQPAPLIFCTL